MKQAILVKYPVKGKARIELTDYASAHSEYKRFMRSPDAGFTKIEFWGKALKSHKVRQQVEAPDVEANPTE
jgi:hypothetical protein